MFTLRRVSIQAFDIPDAYRQVLNAIWYQGDKFVVGYGSEETETLKIHTSVEIAHPENRPLLDDKAPCDMKYVNGYVLEYLWCTKSEENTSTYTYGSRINEPVPQIEEVIRRFKEQPMDRQCTVVIRRPEDILKNKMKDPPCLSLLDYEILDGELNCEVYFRSWDAFAGLPANIAGIQIMNEAIAAELGIKTGKLILHSKNCHIYQRQYKLVEEIVHVKAQKSFYATIGQSSTAP